LQGLPLGVALMALHLIIIKKSSLSRQEHCYIAAYKETSPNKIENPGTIITKPGVRAITIDKKTWILFLSIAEFEPGAFLTKTVSFSGK
jgi:hypothetical protein